MKTKVTDAIIQSIKTEGVDHLFMVPGGFVDPFTDALSKTKDFKTVIAAHESGAVAMADGYARASGKFGAAMCIGGPGITNTLTPLYTAFMDASPLLLISGEVRTDWEGRGFIQDTSPNGPVHGGELVKNITTMTRSLRDTTNLDFYLRGAFKRLLSRTSRGPVHLAIPLNVQSMETDYQHIATPAEYRRPQLLDINMSKDITRILSESTEVAILCGAGASDPEIGEELVRFAETYSIPVASTLAAKGSFPEDHDLSLGVFGWAGLRPAIETLLDDKTEVLIVLGSRMNMQDSLYWNQRFNKLKALIHVDVSQNSIGQHYPTHFPVLADCMAFLKYMTSEMPAEKLAPLIEKRRTWIREIQAKAPRYFNYESRSSESAPIHPARVITEMRKVMPRNTVVAVDNGAHSFFTGHHWDAYNSRDFLSSLRYVGAMGWAIGAGVGAKFARPNDPVVVVTGDGCMLMHGMEVQTAARYHLDMIFVVINNSAFGNPYLRALKVGPEVAKMQQLPTHNWAELAHSLGAKGATITSPNEIAGAFSEARRQGGTWVLNIISDNVPTPTESFDASMLKGFRRLD